MTHAKIAYWALVSVLGALGVFLLAAAARVLRWRMDGIEQPGPARRPTR